ncbi:hypothetical protein MOQ72_35065 [Saccharopolyspora sp. K220]|uniref:hypothetical protein n=1 Tax=Saccharopolyspora soli TaxID=2926618 RepID=UPI001F55BCC7|nr:hypothetical protein [Saccharopolyspora soli]MCI2422660.1 hypothetical protein [Saccharopolyspora soli]
MNAPLQDRPPHNSFAGIREYIAIQNCLWSQHLANLQPWEQEDELRWVRNPITRRWTLRGGVLPLAES